MEAGIDDVGIGVLFGLFDWRYELLALMQHIRHLEARHGVGPHTLSVPRLEPATGSDVAAHPPHAVSDVDFRKIVAILQSPQGGSSILSPRPGDLQQRLLWKWCSLIFPAGGNPLFNPRLDDTQQRLLWKIASLMFSAGSDPELQPYLDDTEQRLLWKIASLQQA